MIGRVREFRSDRVPVPRTTSDARLRDLERLRGPLEIEIGCGSGWHPIAYARANPDRTLVAIEHTVERFARFRSRLARHPAIPNLVAVHADALSWITHHLRERSVDRYFILYPNPRSNWTGAPFTSWLVRTLKEGGQIQFATNLPELASRAVRELTGLWGMRLESAKELQGVIPPGYPRTHFEKKYLLRGERCHDLVFVRPALLSADAPGRL